MDCTGRALSRRVLTAGLCAAVLVTALAATALGATASLTRFLVRSGEETGFTVRTKPEVIKTIKAFDKGDPNAKRDAVKLKKLGFVEAIEEQLSGPHKAVGGTDVVELANAAGARAFTAHEVAKLKSQGKGRYTRLEVPGVASAAGWAFEGSSHSGYSVNVYWVMGAARCSQATRGPGPSQTSHR